MVSLSSKTLGLIVVALITVFFLYQEAHTRKQFIASDGCAYYCYLPAAFIYHDLKFSYVNDLPGDLYVKYWLTTYPGEEYRISKMTIGVAILMTPFFLIAHVYAVASDLPLTGFSVPYHDMIAVSALFYCVIGLFFVRKSLLRFFSEGVTSVALFAVIAATNIQNYLFNEPGMSHVYSFCLVAAMIWATIRWHETFSRKWFFWLCFLLGFITLIRPVNLLTGLFPLLYAMQDRELWQKKMRLIAAEWKTILAGAFIFFIPIVPQIALWKYQTGKWLFDSYVGEHFFFSKPHLGGILFGFRTGWLIYTPVMIISLAGMWFAVRRKRLFSVALAVFIPLELYLLSCWWCWPYSGAMGFRPMIDFYPLLLLPAASFIAAVSFSRAAKIIFSVALVFFTWLNIFQQFQFQRGILHYSDMTAKAYAAIFGRLTYPPDYSSLLDPFDVENAKAGKKLRNMRSFDDFGYLTVSEETVRIKACNGKYLSSDRNLNSLLVANRDSATTWETFTLIRFYNNRAALKAWNGNYLLTLGWGEQKAEMDVVSEEEIYYYKDLGENKIALRAWNGKYLRVELGEPYYVYATSPDMNERTVFTLEK
jgi:hypothetical protein